MAPYFLWVSVLWAGVALGLNPSQMHPFRDSSGSPHQQEVRGHKKRRSTIRDDRDVGSGDRQSTQVPCRIGRHRVPVADSGLKGASGWLADW